MVALLLALLALALPSAASAVTFSSDFEGTDGQLKAAGTDGTTGRVRPVLLESGEGWDNSDYISASDDEGDGRPDLGLLRAGYLGMATCGRITAAISSSRCCIRWVPISEA